MPRPTEIILLPQMQLMSGNIADDCLRDLAHMLEDLYNTGEQRETPNKMRWSGFNEEDQHGSDHSSSLAGRIYKGKQLTIDDNHQQFLKFKNVLMKSADEYIRAFRQYEMDNTSASSLPEKWKLHFQHVWSVYQFEGDYNPIHYHDSVYESTLSGFIHMNVPEGVARQWDTKVEPTTNTRDIDGATEIIWNCNSPRSAIDFRFPGNLFIIPTIGTWFMFPSWLNHVVYPYRGEGCRVSVSWNIGIEWVWPNA
mgnify:CR=1 FL=1|jgi:hypothetical protein